MDTRVNHRGPSGEIAAQRYNETVVKEWRERATRNGNFGAGVVFTLVILVVAGLLFGCQGARIDGTPWGQVELLGADPVANPCDTCTPKR